MYQLFYYPNNASLAPHLILEEIGVEFELKLVDRKSNAQKSAEYLKLNPAGRIPTLIHKDLTLFESPAICIYLAEQCTESNLIPTSGEGRARYHQWIMYLTNTLQAELMIYFYPEKHICKSGENDHIVSAQLISEKIVSAQQGILKDILALLNKELEGKQYLLGDHISVCDFFFFMLAIWADELEHPPLSFANLAGYLKRLAERPSIQRACRTEGISLEEYL